MSDTLETPEATTYTKSYEASPFGQESPLELVTLISGETEVAVIRAGLLRQLVEEIGKDLSQPPAPSDTPETNALLARLAALEGTDDNDVDDLAEHAKNLERQRNSARAERNEARAKHNTPDVKPMGAVTISRNGYIEEIERQLETERTRLAACGVVARADTPESAASARDMLPEHRSASLEDVIRRVDECMRLRKELADARSGSLLGCERKEES